MNKNVIKRSLIINDFYDVYVRYFHSDEITIIFVTIHFILKYNPFAFLYLFLFYIIFTGGGNDELNADGCKLIKQEGIINKQSYKFSTLKIKVAILQ